MSNFTHLHVHTEYSLLDGAARIPELLDKAAGLGMKALAITDHGAMFGVIDFYKAAKKRGINPIIGCEVYMAPRSLTEKEGKQDKDYAHLVLLCQNQEGYQNLIKLVSQGYTQGFYYKPRIDYTLLSQHAAGLICLSACLAGDIPQLLLQNRPEEAKALATRLSGMFPGRFYIELQDHGLPEQKLLNPQLVSLARELKIPLVATNDIHYTNQEDAEAQDALLCIQTGKLIEDADRMRFPGPEFYVKTEQEMAALFPNLPEALENTQSIAEQCHVEFTFGQIKLPGYRPPQGTSEEYFNTLCREGLQRKYGEITPEIEDRYTYEFEMIRRMGYIDYYLIVWDYTHYAKTHGVLVGPGRGSGAGSIAAYALDITTVDPLRYNLLFERFLNPERVSMPDFDVDFDPEGRGRVIEYVTEKYGQQNVAQIITFGTMGARAVVRDVGRVMSLPYQECDRIAKMIPMELGITIADALVKNPQLAELAAAEAQVGKLLRLSQKLEGMPRHASTHAAGVVISREPVEELVPLAVNDNAVVTQFTMKTLEDLGLLKMDFLGLRTLAVVRNALALAQARPEGAPNVYELGFSDPAVYQMIAHGDTDGVFQLESSGMRAFMQQLKPTCFEDIIAGISLFRPGPMDSIPRYVAGKKAPEAVRYLHPLLKPALEVTYGCMVYQEQVMQIARDVAGYSLGRSDILRRAMGKKDRAAMERERQVFIYGLEQEGKVIVPGALRAGVPESVAVEIFEQMRTFAEYAFNKSHAAAYGVIAFQTAWLKYHYPAEFMAATLNSFLGDLSRAAQYIQYCRDKSISVLPPSINHSRASFTVEGAAIRFGLGAVKNVGREALEAIVAEREQNGPFLTLSDFLRRAYLPGHVNKKMLESLIRAGALDVLGDTRHTLLEGFEPLCDELSSVKKRELAGQFSLFSQEETPAIMAPQPEYPRSLLLSMEKEMLGVYISGHPMDDYPPPGPEEFHTGQLNEENNWGQDGREVAWRAIVTAIKQKVTKSNTMMAFVTAEDRLGALECLVFPAVYSRYQSLFQQEAALLFSGSLSVREEETPKLIVEAVAPLRRREQQNQETQAEEPPTCEAVWAQMAGGPAREQQLFKTACELAAQHPGSCAFYLYYPQKKHKQPLPGLSPEALPALRKAFGESNIKVISANKGRG